WRPGYEEPFAGLYAYGPWRCAGLRDVTEEVVQEPWLTAVRRIRDFAPERASFAAWLCGIAANVLRNHWRRERRRAGRTESLNGEVGAVAEDAGRREVAEEVARALAEVSERHEAVLRAKYLHQHSGAEVAAAWDETPKAVESLLPRARQTFREAYRRQEDTHD